MLVVKEANALHLRRKYSFIFLFCSLALFCFGFFILSSSGTEAALPPGVEGAMQGSASQSLVYVISVEGEIGPGWLQYMQRSLEEAEKARADAVILELNTPGGYINTAIEARNLMDKSYLPVYAYVNPHAISAGAYLALACDMFFMAPGASIGAADLRVLGSSAAVDEKTLSAWESDMRSLAQRQGRDPELAAAMIRQEIVIEGVVGEDTILTLTAKEAEDLGFSDGTAANLAVVLEKVGLENARIVSPAPSTWERISGWLINPVVATIILALAFIFLVIEVLTAGFGVAGIFSILCFGLYFGGHFFAGVSGWPAIFLFVLGIILLLVEIFAPGFGVFAVGGILCICASIVLTSASVEAGLRALVIAVIISAVVGYLAFKYFLRKGILRRFINQEALTAEQGFRSSVDYSYLQGKEGLTVTPLRPSGFVEVDDERFNVVSEGDFIALGEQVIISKIEGNRIVVRPIKKGEK